MRTLFSISVVVVLTCDVQPVSQERGILTLCLW